MAETIYTFTGSGGIAGLPHELTMKEAERLKVKEILEAAIKNGNYKSKRASKKDKSEVRDG